MMRFAKWTGAGLSVLLFSLLTATNTFAQTSSIRGSVLDSTGNKIVYAMVSATNTATHVDAFGTTDESGTYKIESLPAGTYRMRAEVQGFEMPEMPNLDLGAGEEKQLDFTMTMLTSERLFRMTRPFFEWAESTWIGKTIRLHQYPFAVIEVFHLFGLTLLLGGIFMMSLRLFGFTMRDMPVPQVAKQLGWISFLGLVIMVTTGLSLFASEANKCYSSTMYWYKMAFFFPAAIFHFTLYRKVTRSANPQPFLRGLTGILALFLWFGVAVFGRAIGYF